MNEGLNRALLEVLKHDEEVSQDDPYYSMTEEQLLPIHTYLGSIWYQPYLDWCNEKEAIADKGDAAIKDNEAYLAGFDESVNDILERVK